MLHSHTELNISIYALATVLKPDAKNNNNPTVLNSCYSDMSIVYNVTLKHIKFHI